jgi:hypothetical protein
MNVDRLLNKMARLTGILFYSVDTMVYDNWTHRLFRFFPLYVKKEKVQNTEFLFVNETEVIINNCNVYL